MNISDLTERNVAIARPMGILDIKGSTRLDIIDRMSTNLVRLLSKGEGAATVLTTDVGRIIDRLLVYQAEDRCIVVTGEDNGDNIARYLLRFVFFNDDFHLTPRHLDQEALFLYGDSLPELLSEIMPDLTLDFSTQPLHHWAETTLTIETQTVHVSLHKTDPIGKNGILLLVDKNQLEQISSLLKESKVEFISEEAFEGLRIEAKLPKLRHELAVDFIPLETGLWDDVSFNKGCYTGQEIIARMDSRGKITRQMVQLKGETALTVGADITSGTKTVGMITSALNDSGLGYVKTSALESPNQLMAGETPIQIISAFEKG